MTASEVTAIEETFVQMIEATFNNDVEGLEAVLENSGNLHPHHCLVLIVKWLLVNLYGRKPGYLNHQLSRERLIAKVTYCKQYLAVLDVIDNGISHNRGITLWHLYNAEMHLLTKAWTDQVVFILHNSKYESHRNVQYNLLA